MSGALRFSQLCQGVFCATAKTLTQQLRELEAGGMMRWEVLPVVPPKVESSLTGFGRSIAPVFAAMCQ